MADDGADQHSPATARPSTSHPGTSGSSATDQSAANLRGMMMMAFAMGVFSFNDTLTKTTANELPTGEIIAIRGIFATLLLGPIVAYSYGLRSITRTYSRAILVRNVSEVFAVILFLSALFRLPIANVTAILQTLPLTMTAAAALLYREPVGWRRWTAASVGLLGVLLIVRPGSVDFSWWYVSAIVSVIFITARDMATKYIDPATPSLVIAFLTAAVVMCAGFGIGMTESWIVPSKWALIRLAAAAVFVLIGYYALIECWRHTEISAVAPFRYTIVLWAMVLGYFFLGEVPSQLTVAGSAIVVATGLYTFHRERVRRAKPATQS